MKTKTILLLFLLCPQFLTAQVKKTTPMLISSDTINYSIFDTTYFYWIERFPNKKLDHEKVVYLNNVPIDTVKYYFNYPRYINNKIILIANEKYFYEVTNKGLKKLALNYLEVDAPNDYFLIKNYQDIYYFNTDSSQIVPFCILSPYLCNKMPCHGYDDTESVYEIFPLKNNNYFIRVCSGDIVCIYNRYFLFNSKNKSVKDISEQIKKFSPKKIFDTELTSITFASNDSNFYCATTRKFQENRKDTFTVKSYIINENLEFVSNILIIGSYDEFKHFDPFRINGLNVQNNKIVNYYLLAILDNKELISVFYKFNPDLEMLFYKAYYNNILDKNVLSRLSDFELKLLKNLIFAKHNYKFKNKFYEAYFNLYTFYNDENKRKSRVEDINKLLTDQDKKNLKIISQLIK